MFHICGISVNQQPVCWGSNLNGQIDIPSTAQLASHITASNNFTCLINSITNLPLCFGLNDKGQTSIPLQLTSQMFKDISGGSKHVCGIVFNLLIDNSDISAELNKIPNL